MSEKRFTLTDWHEVKDNGNIMTVDEVVGKLNEQQATITAQKKGLDEYMDNIIALSKDNEQLQTKIKRQDVTIQTLTENIEKLSDDSKMLELLHKCQEKNEKLRQEIERLQKIIDLTQYQLKVQDRILKEVGE